MGLDSLTQQQRFSLSLAAPVLMSDPDFDCQSLGFGDKDKVAKMLSTQRGIDTRDQLVKLLDWLDNEGGHTIEYLRLHHYLAEMLYSERKGFIASLASSGSDQAVPATLVEQYLYDLGEHTIRAFDIATQSMLIRAGYVMGWFKEDETWQRLVFQADFIVEHGVFKTHFDYLFSFVVGHAFAEKLDHKGVKAALGNARRLVVDQDSPYLSFAPWPHTGKGNNPVEKVSH